MEDKKSKFKKSYLFLGIFLLAFCLAVTLPDYKITIEKIENKFFSFTSANIGENNWDNKMKDKTIKEKLQDKDYQNYLRESDSFRIKKGEKYKSYNSSEKRLKIEDKDFNVLVDIKLESDYEEAVMVWNNMSLSAWFDLSDFSGEDFVDNVRFFDVNNNYTEIFREYIFKYKEKQNISIFNEFYKEYEIIEDDIWVEFNNLSELPNKNIKIGLFIDIIEGDKIEWVIEKDGFEIIEWALVVGTNCGFVTTAPTGDPSGASSTWADNRVRGGRFQASGDGVISEIGFYIQGVSEDTTIEVGIYEDDNGEPGNLSEKSSPFAKGTSIGWKLASGFSASVINGTYYWLAFSMTDSASATNIDAETSGGTVRYESGQISLEDTWDTANDFTSNYLIAIYAVWEEAGDLTKPTYSNNAHNTTIAGTSVNFSIDWNDNSALQSKGQYIFSTNNSGSWVNDSAVNFTSTPQTIWTNKTLNSTVGLSIGYRWYGSDNAGNVNNTEIYSFITTSANCWTETSGKLIIPPGCKYYTNVMEFMQ